MKNTEEYLNWEGLDLYTKDFKEWLFKLLHKIHARIGHVEEDIYKIKEQSKSSYSLKKRPSGTGVEYVLIDDYTKKEHGSINIEAKGIVLSTWEEDLNI